MQYFAKAEMKTGRTTDPVFFDEVNEGRPLDLDWLSVSVVQR